MNYDFSHSVSTCTLEQEQQVSPLVVVHRIFPCTWHSAVYFLAFIYSIWLRF
ncbi:hypothetical protein DL95DRAFT_395442 [Leptodontidium sp. 2 PMI_412]|nr:hypothetical protein DL95DRAFT_395442 [Leptodontidium sp. 2 PMI_412]